ncbi:MAG TPA: hypothetical protein VEX68_25580 [Bryobacteraceae bacterium]|nr:hypothetical protein [Bryobacteraceae bacterium]
MFSQFVPLAIFVCSLPLVAQAIRVIEIDKGWTLQSKPLGWGEIVPSASEISGERSSVNLVLECKKAWLAYSCRNVPCKVTPCVTAASGEVYVRKIDPPTFVAGLSTKLEALWKRKARAPVTLAARAGGSPNDAFLLQDERGVHWGPSLHRVLEGKYCFRLSHLWKDVELKTFTFEWDRGVDPEGIAKVGDLAPGGYLLEKGLNGSCTPDPESLPAWVVIAAPDGFAKLNPEWQKSAKWLEQLSSEGASVATVTTARQGVLATMAEIVEGP